MSLVPKVRLAGELIELSGVMGLGLSRLTTVLPIRSKGWEVGFISMSGLVSSALPVKI